MSAVTDTSPLYRIVDKLWQGTRSARPTPSSDHTAPQQGSLDGHPRSDPERFGSHAPAGCASSPSEPQHLSTLACFDFIATETGLRDRQPQGAVFRSSWRHVSGSVSFMPTAAGETIEQAHDNPLPAAGTAQRATTAGVRCRRSEGRAGAFCRGHGAPIPMSTCWLRPLILPARAAGTRRACPRWRADP